MITGSQYVAGIELRRRHARTVDNGRSSASDEISRERNPVDQHVANRLRAARRTAGYATGQDFARAIGVNQTTYYHHENGRRGIPDHVAAVYAEALGMSLIELLHGDELRNQSEVPIVGVIGHGGIVSPMTDTLFACYTPNQERHRKDDEEDPAKQHWWLDPRFALPKLRGMERLVVTDTSMHPAYRENDIVFCMPLQRGQPIDPSLHGQDCVIELPDGQRLLKTVMIQPNGLLTLVAANRPHEFNVRVVAISPVELIQRGPRATESVMGRKGD
jgi:DNA-binding XRE family transcriptional regulator